MNVLFIAPRFYSYHCVMKMAFEKKGHTVQYFDDRAGIDFFTKAVMRINKNLLKRKNKKYFQKILLAAKQSKFDLVFVIYGQCLDNSMIRQLKEELPNARFVFYMYDPIASMPDRLEFSKEFDKKFSFDFDDVKKYPEFELLPLFYSKTEFPKNDIEYDACYIGTMMPGKYRVVNDIIDNFNHNKKNVYSYQFVQSKMVALFYKFFYKDFKKAKINQFATKRISQCEVNEIISKSKYIIDCPKQNQSGLTIRIFEAMFAKKKIITSNKSVVNYPFYSEENFYLYDGKEIDFNSNFFETKFMPIADELLEKYEINNWIDNILEA